MQPTFVIVSPLSKAQDGGVGLKLVLTAQIWTTVGDACSNLGEEANSVFVEPGALGAETKAASQRTPVRLPGNDFSASHCRRILHEGEVRKSNRYSI